ncbi:chromosome partitioning protein ParB [Paenibacillus lautus]|uniref:chromosome partitioning protein ParB n=1 Tax=Paenibacillus lautus TaxID=1401 RepID=UPI000BBDD6B5|nr:chromosome partitioning protein ParB [Paenibacillus lautus]PCL93019.1 chromosome partitioning protein ParB [Paenibacillus lautus]
MNAFTLSAANEYALANDIETWVHLFLNGEGDNIVMSEDLKKKKRYWLGPIEIDMKYLERIVGPEEHLEYEEDIKWWNYNIDQICSRFESGWDMPPLIAKIENGNFRLHDGNHRLGALQKLNKEKYYLIIWDDHSYGNIINHLKNCGIDMK